VEKPKKPRSNLAIIGLYYISQTAGLRSHLAKLVESGANSDGEIQLTDALQGMISDGAIFNAHSVEGWYDCGKRETLIATNQHLLQKHASTQTREGSVIIPPSYISASATVESSIIGPFVSISDRAVIKNAIIRTSKYLKKTNKKIKVEIEAGTIEDVEEILKVGMINIIMLDNFSVKDTKEAVKLIKGRYEIESSGKINLENVRDYAECGVDYISVGALTHRFKSLDMSMKAVKY